MNHTHIANQVPVVALRILEVTDVTNRDGDSCQTSPELVLRLENGFSFGANMAMTARYIPVVGDYLVTQEDGYQYLNPKDVFERKYSPIQAMLDFGGALQSLKAGKRVARTGWNGKGMWLSLSGGAKELHYSKFWSVHNADFAERQPNGTAEVLPCITMKTATGEILMGWLASQTDMLAEDWVVLP